MDNKRIAVLIEWLMVTFATLVQLIRDGKRGEHQFRHLKVVAQSVIDSKPHIALQTMRGIILSQKLAAVRRDADRDAHNRRMGGTSLGRPVMHLVGELCFLMHLAAEEGILPRRFMLQMENASRAEIITNLIYQIKPIWLHNLKLYGSHLNPLGWFRNDSEMYLWNWIIRLTRDEMLAQYGIEDWGAVYRSSGTFYMDDVRYAAFLQSHDLMSRTAARSPKFTREYVAKSGGY